MCVSPVPGLSALTPEPDRTPDGQPVPEAVKGGTAVYAYAVCPCPPTPNSSRAPFLIARGDPVPDAGRETLGMLVAPCCMHSCDLE